MKLRRKSNVARLLVALIAFGAALVSAEQIGLPPLLFVPAVTFAIWLAQSRIPTAFARRAFVTLARQTLAEDVRGARMTLLDLRELYLGSRAGMEQLRLYEAQLMSLERRHAEAAALLASIDRNVLGEQWSPVLLNNLAWYRVLAGDAPGALSAARAAMKASEEVKEPFFSAGTDLRALQLGTLGSALALSGQGDEAMPLLEQAHARGGTPRTQASRSFFLGEALRAQGRDDDASAAYARAVTEAKDTELGERAAARLVERKAYRA